MKNTENDSRFSAAKKKSFYSDAFVEIYEDTRVSEAIKYIRSTVPDGGIECALACDRSHRLVGTVALSSLIFADPCAKIKDIMTAPSVSVCETDEADEVCELISKAEPSLIPVTDDAGHPVGVITYSAALEMIEDAANEDISIMSAVTPNEEPYLNTGVFDTFAARIPWLLLLMISATFTGIIITAFESALSSLVILTAFIPMLMGTGGNAGAQVSVTVTRSLSLGELSFSDSFRVLKKEFSVSLLCGGVLGGASFVKVWLFDMLLLRSEGVTLSVAATVGLTLFFTVVAAKLTGAILPLSASRAGLDPALVSSPAITTAVDIISLIVYFGTAKLLLGI